MNIIKRDGSVVPFDRNKVTLAIKKALEACDMSSDTIALSVTEDVVTSIGSVPEINQESVLDLVEDMLMKRGLLKAAKAFIRYRERHALARNSNIELYNGVLDKLAAKHVQNQNANIDENSFGGRMGEANILVLKDVAMKFKMSDKTRNDHVQNIVYQHDSEHWATGESNCQTMDLTKILKDGFAFRQGDIRSPKHIESALQDMVVAMQLQETQMFGGVGVMVDFAMVPYVRMSLRWYYIKRAFEDYILGRDFVGMDPGDGAFKDMVWKYPVPAAWYSLDDEVSDAIKAAFAEWYMKEFGLTDEDFTFDTKKLNKKRKKLAIHDCREEAHQAIEAVYHNLVSVTSRSPQQLPFTSWNTGCCTEPEGRLITEQILRCCKEGIGKLHKTAVFPCTIFICKKGVNLRPGDPNYDLFRRALDCTARRLYPTYVNDDWSTQQKWIAQDRKDKEAVIESLTEDQRNTLLDRISKNPDVAEKLMLKVVDGKIEVDKTEKVFEIINSMGCVSGSAVIDYRLKTGEAYVESFESAWERLSKKFEVKLQPNGRDFYMDTDGVYIYDARLDEYKAQTRMIKNSADKWIKVWFANGAYLRVTPDHPFSVFSEDTTETVTRADAIKVGDRMIVDNRVDWGSFGLKFTTVEAIEECVEPGFSYDVTTASEHFTVNGIYSHNCRTMLGYDVHAQDSYVKAVTDVITKGDTDVDILSGAQKTGRGNIAPATIILPELAMTANRDVEAFMQLLEIKIQDAAESLMERFEIIKAQPPSAAPFMYGNRTMAGYVPEEGIESALKHGTFAIGQLGLAETLQLLIGKDHTTPEGMELAKRIEQLYLDKVNELRVKYKMNFSTYATPAENLAYTALVKFREKHGVIPNVSDKEFFTNSIHIVVWKRMNAFEKIDLESQLTGYITGGVVTWAELDSDVKNNIDALEELVRYAMEKDIPYFGPNFPNDQCQDCGYLGEIEDKCPKCGSLNIKRLRRVTGYLGQDYHQFNPGKIDEVQYREKHIG